MTERPRYTLPERMGKFVQLYIDDNAILRHGEITRDSHANILRQALDEYQIPYETQESSLSSEPRDVPQLTGDRYRVVGAGAIMVRTKSIILTSNSSQYLIGPNQQHLDDLKPHLDGIEAKIM